MVTDRLQISEREPLPAIDKVGLAGGTTGSHVLRRQGTFMTGPGGGERGVLEPLAERVWCSHQSGRSRQVNFAV